MLDWFIGYDPREDLAYNVCERSILKHASEPVHIQPLVQRSLRWSGLYRRAPFDQSKVDSFDGKPYSTEFSFTRFLVPALKQWRGWAGFCDCDFLFREDIAKLWALRDDKYAVMCVKHDHRPKEHTKMDNQRQEIYPRKNWSSLMLLNCGHPLMKALTVDAVNLEPGSWLHGLRWLRDEDIGGLPLGWNYLVGWNTKTECIDPMAVHYTAGTPNMSGYENCEYADLWWEEAEAANVGAVEAARQIA